MSPNAVFRLSERIGNGVYCGEEGLFVGSAPVLEAVETDLGFAAWRVRNPKSLERDLSAIYGMPIDFRRKLPGAETVARALTRGDLALAQIAALLLRLPDPPRSGSMKTAKRNRPQLFENTRNRETPRFCPQTFRGLAGAEAK